MMATYQIPENNTQELARFDEAFRAFQAGEMDPVRWKAVRVGFGVYEQRTSNTYMVRIRCGGGVATPYQLRQTALLAKRYAAPHLHVTTRFELQLHDLPFEHIPTVVRELPGSALLSSRGGGGNTIRNITASSDAGIHAEEPFDVTPYALALTSRMIAEKDSFILPRKFKIAFSNTGEDTAYATVMDLGFIARIENGRKGFRVFVAGGMGAKAREGKLLHDFLPDDQVYSVTKALKIMFDRVGNRRNKHANRLRFLWDKLGKEQFRRLYEEALEELQAENPAPLELHPVVNEGREPDFPPVEPVDEGFALWKFRYVRPQKQPGLASVLVPLELGDISADDAIALADLLEPFGENVLRFTKEQNIHVRNIPEDYLGYLYNGIRKLGTHSAKPSVTGNMIACMGASTCTLGICLSRDLVKAIDRRLSRGNLELDALNGFRINISGCPNSCGQHHTGQLGFYGKVSRVGGHLLPAYYVMGGARIHSEGSSFATQLTEVVAKDVPEFLYNVLEKWIEDKGRYPDFKAWLDNGGGEKVKTLAEGFNSRVPAKEHNPDYYVDWGSKDAFSVAARGVGECSAGLYDMIGADLKTARKNLPRLDSPRDGERREAVALVMRAASRMLLITRGLEPVSDDAIYRDFQRHFIDAGLIGGEFALLITLARQQRFDELSRLGEMVALLAGAVEALYKGMDDSLRFPLETTGKAS